MNYAKYNTFLLAIVMMAWGSYMLTTKDEITINYEYDVNVADTIAEEIIIDEKIEVRVLYQTMDLHQIDALNSSCPSGISLLGECQNIEPCFENNYCIEDTNLRIIFASEGLKNLDYKAGEIIIIDDEQYIIIDQVSCYAGNCHFAGLQLEILVDVINENNKKVKL